MSGLRAFFEKVFGISPTNPIAPSGPPVLHLVRARSEEEDELVDLIHTHLREGRRAEALTDPAFFDRKAVLFARMATAELRRAWEQTELEQHRYHMRLSVRATETAQRSRRRARELRAAASSASVWSNVP